MAKNEYLWAAPKSGGDFNVASNWWNKTLKQKATVADGIFGDSATNTFTFDSGQNYTPPGQPATPGSSANCDMRFDAKFEIAKLTIQNYVGTVTLHSDLGVDVLEVPAYVVRVTWTVPAAEAGARVSTCVGDCTTNHSAGMLPKFTAVAPARFVPVIVTYVLFPAGSPMLALSPDTVGVEADVYVY